jgi:Transcriptional regulator
MCRISHRVNDVVVKHTLLKEAPAPVAAPRVSKRRERTRANLVEAARSLVFERGHEKIAIQDITERAGVGLGTFYNYFETKTAVFEAVLDAMRAAFTEELDALRAPLKDPAFIVAVTLRHCFCAAQDNEEWNTFIAYAGLDGEHLLHQPPEQLLGDIKRGVSAGRFKVEDVHFAQSLIMGMVKHVTREIRSGRLNRSAMDDTTQYVLRMLGLPDLVARALVQTPAPNQAPKKAASPDDARPAVR